MASEINCFVSNCTNKQSINERGRLQFFPVPDGIERLFWFKAVKSGSGHRNYEKLIEFLSGVDSTLKEVASKSKKEPTKKKSLKRKSSKQKSKSPPPTELQIYCCEVHFDIDTDIDRVLNENGLVEYKVKPGAVPSIKARQHQRLCDVYGSPDDVDDFDMNTDIVKSEESISDVVIGSNIFDETVYDGTIRNYVSVIEETKDVSPIKNYVSIVDIATLTYQKNNVPLQTCYEVTTLDESNDEPIIPMLPSTIALMKRKSMYYMGQERKLFLRLLQLASQRTQLSEVKVMITLRKLQLNEEFETLGDLFDLNKTTAEQYFHESKHLVINLVDILASTPQTNTEMSSEPMIKVELSTTLGITDPTPTEPKTFRKTYNVIEEDEDDRSSAAESSYEPEDDPDFKSEDYDSDSSCGNVSTNLEKTDECSICKKFYTSRGLVKHMDCHLNFQNLNKTICGLCLRTFDTHLLLRAHQKDAHDGCSHGCDLCGKELVSKKSMEGHILTKHAKLRTYRCGTCGEGFPTNGYLSYHVKIKHIQNRDKKCHLCDKKYFDKQTLDAHIRAVHTSERPFKCKVKGCSKTFNRKNCFETHKRVHATDKFMCKICSKEFSLKANLRTHLKNIHGQTNVAI